ncbi:sensor histidine kinase [Pandoraea pulmonicola]|uniref:histidine kinase n=1 Tax=Pandoraea pulmonicola TaxID=93221 RepID=A0AAJ5D290_PANPU|nr:HAMP domain-containing sensor histidine kinase [Pandoraea pulmonicola]AJC19468.1 hypothetical protein RO07_01325 [Pandoraea pulmonicola]SUA92494.1 Sensor protein qseC [Pandoraea pulmonicola]
MSFWRPRSLRWRLVQRMLVAQWVMVAVLTTLSFTIFASLWLTGTILGGVHEFSTIDALKESIGRAPDGSLVLRDSPSLKRLRAEVPDLWFIVEDDSGHVLRDGTPPAEIQALLPLPTSLSDARFSNDAQYSSVGFAVARRVESPAGRLRMVTGTQGRVTLRQIVRQSESAYNLALYLAAMMGIAALVVTPIVVRRALRSLGRVSAEAERIDIDSIGVRLDTRDLPSEMLPLVNAVNGALARLDKGIEARKRFIADAAHELRTPIAILTTRIAALPSGAARNRLQEDCARLATLADQLLDLQRLDQSAMTFTQVDLVALAQRVVADMAPMTFAGGYDMAFDADGEHVFVRGDELAIERALTNLIQNAANYGRRRGTITVRVSREAWMEVCDEGDGIPEDQRHSIFEPYRRLSEDTHGIGLGLDLVQRVMHLHGGEATVTQSAPKGACFRLSFPM